MYLIRCQIIEYYYNIDKELCKTVTENRFVYKLSMQPVYSILSEDQASRIKKHCIPKKKDQPIPQYYNTKLIARIMFRRHFGQIHRFRCSLAKEGKRLNAEIIKI